MPFTKVAPAGIGTEPGDGYRIGDSFLHATGLSLGSGTTISHSGSASFSGIVTASSFVGSGSGLTGVASTDHINSSTNAVLSGIVTAGTLNVSGNATVTGTLGVGGTLTYEDVTNIDSVGVITARSGIRIAAGSTVGPISGIVTYYGDGSGLTNTGAITSIASDGANRVLTSDGDGTATAHSFVTIENNRLSVNRGSGSGAFPLIVRRTDASGIIAEFANSSGYGLLIGQNSATGEAYLRTGTGQPMVFTTNAGSGITNERLRITSDGKLLYGTTTDYFGGTGVGVSGQLSIGDGTRYRRIYQSGNGNFYFWNGSNQPYISSGGNWTNSSDVNLKKDINDLSYGIDVLKNLKPRKYKMKADNKEQIGFIAQEVESFIPEVVDIGETPDGTEQKGLSYGNLTAVLTKALQEAIAKIEKLEAKVAALEGS